MEAGASIAASLGVTAAVLSPDPVWGNAVASPANVDTDRVAAEYAGAAADPDAALLALGRELTVCHEAEARAWLATDEADADDDDPLFLAAETAGDRVCAVIAQIETCTATTLPGVLVKARALAWCRSNDPVTVETFADEMWSNRGAPTTDMRLTASLLRDLNALARGFA